MSRPKELPPQVKLYIVQALACFERPQAVAKAVKDEFGLEVTRQRVHYYDPTTRLGETLQPELKEKFHAIRKTFLEDVSTIPIANKAVQLRALQRQLDKIENSPGASALAIPVIEAAAKISGTLAATKNEHKHEGAIPVTPVINLYGRPQSDPAPQAVDSVRKPGD